MHQQIELWMDQCSVLKLLKLCWKNPKLLSNENEAVMAFVWSQHELCLRPMVNCRGPTGWAVYNIRFYDILNKYSVK